MRVSDGTLSSVVSQHADEMKGLLILIVAADHNEFFRLAAPSVFEPLTFHVLGFFLLTFSFNSSRYDANYLRDRAVRYLVPFLWTLSLLSLAFHVLYQQHAAPAASLMAWAMAALIGNAPFVKASSGFLMLWFLPSLFGLTCLIAAYGRLGTRWPRRMAIALACAGHLVLPLLPRSALLCIPWGLAIMAQIFLLGLVWRRMLLLPLPKYWGMVCATVFVTSYAALVVLSVPLEVATFDLVGIDRPGIMVLQDLAGVAGVLSVLWCAKAMAGFRCLKAIGKHSLWIYLLHPVVYVVLWKVWFVKPDISLGAAYLWVHGCLTGMLAVGMAYLAALLMSRSSLVSAWIAPRSWERWAPSRLLVSLTQIR